MRSEDRLLNPPMTLVPAGERQLSRTQREKSAVREAITEVCDAAMGERGSKLTKLLEKIEEQEGPKAAFDAIVKLLEFTTPKLQRVTVEDPDGNAPRLLTLNINFGRPVKIVSPEDGDIVASEAPEQEP